MQGSRDTLIRRHKRRIDDAQGSVLSHPSLSEGLDLPGDYPTN